MEGCDVLIIGGGPAGSSCARRLRGSGLDVLVCDAREFPRDKVCAGWITPEVLDELEIDPGEYARGRTFQPIYGFHLGRMRDPESVVVYDAPVSYGIRRCEFDHYLLARSGARLRLGETVRQIRRDGASWFVNESVRARVVVGAGGHSCPVARHLGARVGSTEPIVAAQEIEFELPAGDGSRCLTRPEAPELFFTPDLKGYGWIFRKGDFLNVGLGRQDTKGLGLHIDSFLEFLALQGRVPPGLPVKWKGHAYLLYGQSPRRLVADGALLIGDAAGLAYVRSGEGIRPAVESGLLAGRVLLAAQGSYERERLVPYRQLLEARFGEWDTAAGLDLTRFVPRRAACWIAGRLLAWPRFAQHVVLDRWFFQSHQPRLTEWMDRVTGPGVARVAVAQ